jgi:Mn-containing catalase
MTDDRGMRDMLAFLIARDTMHQQQWQAVLVELEEQGGVFPIPNSFPQERENHDVNYVFLGTNMDPQAPIPQGRWTSGSSLDGKAQFKFGRAQPMGQEPVLAPPRPDGFAQTQQMVDGAGGLLEKVKNALP